jgi:hypothetical protein
MPGWGDVPPMPGEFERRNCDTRDQINLASHRRCWQPSPYRSHTEYLVTLAAAYQAREAFYDDLIACAMRHGPGGMWFTVLLDARDGCREVVRRVRDEVRRAARFEQEQAWRSYAGNLAVLA